MLIGKYEEIKKILKDKFDKILFLNIALLQI